MSKTLNHLPQVTQYAIKQGACAWVEKIDVDITNVSDNMVHFTEFNSNYILEKSDFISRLLSHKIGDKVYLAEDFNEGVRSEVTPPENENLLLLTRPASEMTYEQARHKGVVVDVKIVRAKDIASDVSLALAKSDMITTVGRYYKQLEINYDSNPYVIYTEIKRG